VTDDLAGLRVEQLREALQLLKRGGAGIGQGGRSAGEAPTGRPGVGRALRALLSEPGFLREELDDAPDGAREAFSTLVADGPRSVESLLGRGWWGRGMLPPPLDWLQRRALIVVGDAGLVHAVAAARQGWLAQRLQLDTGADADPDSGGEDDPDGRGETDPEEPQQPHLRLVPAAPDSETAGSLTSVDNVGPRPVSVEAAGSVVVTEHPEDLDLAMGVPEAELRSVAPTVAVSKLGRDALADALRAKGVRLRSDVEVRARSGAPALPGSAERAVTPWDLRELFTRAVEEDRQLHLVYYPSSRGGAATERTVDPWTFADDLLTGWCHLRRGERTFAIDRVGGATLLGSGIEHASPHD
jgi:hypothetical protein